jgi:alkanesulfonate monooxygenase SsuD/methylene tetrahydromethanopterin reductase-like flavin-dependent oxidoreductase (luciferase family)
MKRLSLGIHVPVMEMGDQEFTRETMLSSARRAEQLGFDSLSVNDHITHRTSWLDPLETLAAAAAVTSKITLATSILNIVVRNPVISMKALSAVDILSSGRLVAGIGPGSHKADYEACGVSFEERWGRFRESTEILSRFWGKDSIEYRGEFYRLEKVSVKPGPVQKPRPPLMVGSWGSERILKIIAEYADGWMASAYNISPEDLKAKSDLLMAYRRESRGEDVGFETSVMTMFCYISPSKERALRMVRERLSPALGRSSEELEKLLPFGSAEECVRTLGRLAEAGARRVHLWPVADYSEQLEILAKEVIPAFEPAASIRTDSVRTVR